MRRIDSLDGLRALAVLLVFIGHVDQRELPGGFVGVEVFFVISGYLITSLLLREHARTGSISLRHFYARRALRLWPALALFIAVMTPIAAADRIGRPVPDGIAALLYLTDFWANVSEHFSLLLHTWSLAVEEQFYLVWPAALTVILRHRWDTRRITVLLLMVVLAGVGLTFWASTRHVPLVQFLPSAHLAELVAGVLLAVAIDETGALPGMLEPTTRAWVAGICLAGLLGFELLVPARWWSWPAATILAAPIVGHLVVNPAGRMARGFARRELVWLGRRSYGFYLWHYAIVELLLRSLGIWMTGLVGLLLTLLVSAASWRIWEQPFLRFKERFAEVHVEEGDERGAEHAAASPASSMLER